MEAKIRKWGNSFGILLPKEELEHNGLRVNDNVRITIEKQQDISSYFGILKDNPIDAQKMKDEIRREEQEDDQKLLRQLRNHRIPQR